MLGKSPGGRISRRGFLGGMAGGLGLALSHCAKSAAPRSVVWVVLDTVRADHCSLHGYSQPTTPNLAKLAAQGQTYGHAIAPAPWTLPSHASMFTGQYPFMTGVRTFLAADGVVEPPLAPESLTIAEALAESGYATSAYVANSVYLTRRYQLDQGFDTYVVDRIPGVDLAEQALAWVTRQRGGPFFLFVNVMDAHVPLNTDPRPEVWGGEVAQDKELILRYLEQVLDPACSPAPGMREAVTRQYDTGVANADRALGRLLEGLERRDLLEHTQVIATSDHGHFIGEHGLAAHSKDVYEPVAHVPLVIRTPGRADHGNVREPYSLTRLPSRVLDYTLGSGGVRYRGLHACKDMPVITENHFSRRWDLENDAWRERFLRERYAVYDGTQKFIRSSDGADELFDLAADPGELDNLAGRMPARAAAMAERLTETLGAAPFSSQPGGAFGPTDLTPEEEEEMRALGYG